MYCYTSEFWSELGSPGEACTSLSEFHLAGDSQDQLRSDCRDLPVKSYILQPELEWLVKQSEAGRVTGEVGQ